MEVFTLDIGLRIRRKYEGLFVSLNVKLINPTIYSGAIFLAVSEEMSLARNHDIVYNGYNLGRDWFVGNVTNQQNLIPTTLQTVNETYYSGVTNMTTYSGDKTFNNYTYHTDVQYVSGLLRNSSGECRYDERRVRGRAAN